jgi:hypothetical protein
MKDMKNIYKILLTIIGLMPLCSCGDQYDPLPPKTDASLQYALPYPDKPSQEEIDALLKVREEHENSTKQ